MQGILLCCPLDSVYLKEQITCGKKGAIGSLIDLIVIFSTVHTSQNLDGIGRNDVYNVGRSCILDYQLMVNGDLSQFGGKILK